MKLIVISSSHDVENEVSYVEAMMTEGLNYFHLRKPHYTTKDYVSYLEKFRPEFRSKIIIHSRHHLCKKYKLKGVHISRRHKKLLWRTWYRIYRMRINYKFQVSIPYHNLKEIQEKKNKKYEYMFLSPIFDSISKKGRKAAFKEKHLKKALQNATSEVIALGGVGLETIEKAHELGFDGVAVLGAVWEEKDPLEAFRKINEKCQQLSQMSLA